MKKIIDSIISIIIGFVMMAIYLVISALPIVIAILILNWIF